MPEVTDTTTDEVPVALTKADIPRVDGVKGPANGVPFLVVKALENEANADAVAAALADESVTVAKDATGIDGKVGALNEVATPQPELGAAADATPTDGEVQTPADMLLVEPATADPVEVTPSVEVTKADGEQEMPAGPEDADPGSPEWEAKDAGNLKSIATQLVQLRAALEEAAERERAEAYSDGVDDEDDWLNAWDLDDAASALDSALAIAARLSFTEQAEAGEGVQKSLAIGDRLSDQSRAALAAFMAPAPAVVAPITPEVPVAEAPAAEPADVAKATEVTAETPQVEAPSEPTVDVAAEVTKALESDVFKSVLEGAVSAAIAPLQEAVAKAEGRLETVEKMRAPGPRLRGAGQDVFLVDPSRFGGPVGLSIEGERTPEAVQKALAAITDPVAREQASREAAVALHPIAAQPQ